MRIFHTSDWHLGRHTLGVSRRSDLEAVLEEILEQAREFKPHLILHSGDVFENSRPAVEDMELAQTVLRQMSELAPTVVIAGNHDSVPLFGFFDRFVGKPGKLVFADLPRPPKDGGILEFPGDKGETARVALFPFLHANRVLNTLALEPGSQSGAYADRVKKIQQSYQKALTQGYRHSRHVLLFCAHLHVGGAITGTSERPLHISDAYATRPESIPQVSYAAFGHIHKPQSLPGNIPGRYAGSPIQLDFGEEGEQKQVVLIEVTPGRSAQVTPVPLSSGRRLHTLKGSQAELEARVEEVKGDIIKLLVHTEEPTPELADWAHRVFQDSTLVEVREKCLQRQQLTVEEGGDLPEHFEDMVQAFSAYLQDSLPEDQSELMVRREFGRLHDLALDPLHPTLPEELVALEALQP